MFIYINCRPAPRWSDLPRLSVRARKQNKNYVPFVYSSRACLGKSPEHQMRNLKLNSVATVGLSCCFLVLVFALPTGEALLPGCCGAERRPSARRRCVLFISGTFLCNKKPQQQHPIVAAALRFKSFQFVSIRFNSFQFSFCACVFAQGDLTAPPSCCPLKSSAPQYRAPGVLRAQYLISGTFLTSDFR